MIEVVVLIIVALKVAIIVAIEGHDHCCPEGRDHCCLEGLDHYCLIAMLTRPQGGLQGCEQRKNRRWGGLRKICGRAFLRARGSSPALSEAALDCHLQREAVAIFPCFIISTDEWDISCSLFLINS